MFVIAEAGVNHNGSIGRAMEMVEAAKHSGADAVKFQIFKTEYVVTKTAEKAAYQNNNVGKNISQYEMIKALELSYDDFIEISDLCGELNIEFMATAFDTESLSFMLNEIGVKRIKIASGEVTNAPLLYQAAKADIPILLSTGMCTLSDIEDALSVISHALISDQVPSIEAFRSAYSSVDWSVLRNKVSLLHCTSDYPAKINNINLHAMKTLSNSFHLDVGYSDHSKGYEVPLMALAMGAHYLEKHFTLDCTLPGPDHIASMQIDEFENLVKSVRMGEEALGQPIKRRTFVEQDTAKKVRRGIVCCKSISKGDLFTESNIVTKRPCEGIEPMMYWDVIGKRAVRDIAIDEALKPSDVEGFESSIL